jgi:putative DNA methylase
MADLGNSLVRWEPIAQCPRQLFGRHAIPIIWDFAEANPIGQSSGSWSVVVDGMAKALASAFGGTKPWFRGHALQAAAQTQTISKGRFVSCDPPYYDNIGYADLSDFFYVWLRRSLRSVFPELLSTISVPKSEELVATPARHGGRDRAEQFFLDGMTAAMRNTAAICHPEAPITIYYAFKQAETEDESGTSSAGWTTFLSAVLQASLQITGTWPIRTENASRMRGQTSNALASSVVLVCRKRPNSAPVISRRELLRELNAVLPEALDEMTKGSGEDRSPVAPVDLSQAIIGPGMAVFSRYSAVLEADGSPMSVKTALQLINRFLAEDDFDHDTQFCLHWFDQHGWGEGAYGEADVLARAKATSVSGLSDAGVVESGAGKVRLLRRLPIWEALHQLVRAIRDDGETEAGLLLAAVKPKSEAIRQLAYRLYTLCERRGWADDARAYNELVTSWSAVESAAGEVPDPSEQLKLFGGKK